MHITSKRAFVPLVDTVRLHECAPTAGTRNPTDPRLEPYQGEGIQRRAIVRNKGTHMCGIIGIVGRIDSNVNQALYDGLTVLQHRGQDAAGIMTEKSEKFNLRKGNGLAVSDVFYKRHMHGKRELLGHIGIGHVRYPTAGRPLRQQNQGRSPTVLCQFTLRSCPSTQWEFNQQFGDRPGIDCQTSTPREHDERF